ncbi:MAG: S41 family peptidase [Bacteroidota bacterium]
MTQHKNSRQAIRLPLYVGIAIAFGVFIGANMAKPGGSSNSLQQSLSKLRQILTYVENDYVDDVDTEELIEGAIEHMLQNLDPHTNYISSEDIELMRSQLQGNFEGIGIEFNIFKDTIHVVAPLSGGPSIKAGLLPGDKIIKVDGEEVAGQGFQNRDVIDRLRGEKGTKVIVSISRKGKSDLIDYEITRDVIPQYSVDVSYMIDQEIGYIKVSRFSATTYMEFKEALNNLREAGMSRLILDLTGNPGGYLDRAVDMVDEFLKDDQIIVYTEGKESRYNERHLSKNGGDFEEGDLIVLIDQGSASASEIVSGAIQDYDRGLIVGRRSYGKGLVQLPISLEDGSELRLTISRYYTPSGRSIQKPYSDDIDQYHQEYVARFNEGGEGFNEDSIKVDESKVFTTQAGRKVYGGGGIVPDHFVPLDTLGRSDYLDALFTSNSFAEFSLNYSQDHKSELESMGLDTYLADFEVTDAMIRELVASAKSNKISYDEEDFKTSEERIKLYIKAFIGRNVWNNEGFFPLINQIDPIYRTALDILNGTEQLEISGS